MPLSKNLLRYLYLEANALHLRFHQGIDELADLLILI